MRALTFWQPWASLIALGHKTIETRTHEFRGLIGRRLAIHAGGTFHAEAADLVRAAFAHATPEQVAAFPISYDQLEQHGRWPRACIVAVATVADMRKLHSPADDLAALSPAEGLYGIIFKDIVALDPPLGAKGKQGVWDWPLPDNLKHLET